MYFRAHLSWSLVGLLSVSLAFAQHPAPKPPPPTTASDSASIADGRASFQSNCGFCHGNDARGNRAPDLIRSSLVVHDENGNLIGPVIRNGRPDKGMPAFGALKAGEVANIVAFLHAATKAALRSGGVSRDYPAAKLLTGNADAGKRYFDGAGGCSHCHSVTGDLAGIAKKYSPIDLQQHIVYPGHDVHVTATVVTKDGKQFEGRVTEDDEFTIGIVCQDGWVRSWSRNTVKVVINDPLAAHREVTEKLTDADMHNLFAYLETLQ